MHLFAAISMSIPRQNIFLEKKREECKSLNLIQERKISTPEQSGSTAVNRNGFVIKRAIYEKRRALLFVVSLSSTCNFWQTHKKVPP